MTMRFFRLLALAFLVAALLLSEGPPISAQMGPGQMGPGQMGPGMMGQSGARGQTSTMPMPQMAEVIKQMADRLAARKPLDPDKAERLRRLADQIRAAATQTAESMGGGMSGMMGGGMMAQASQQMAEMTRILNQMSDLLRDQ